MSPRLQTILCGLIPIAFSLLLFVPLFVLGAAIGWPDSLSDPAPLMLPRLLDKVAAVRLGYGGFFLHSLLFLPAVIVVAEAAKPKEQPFGVFATLALIFAGLSLLARLLGILRWLGPAMELAQVYSSAPSESAALIAAAQQDAINLYAGAVGEVLGDVLLAGLSLLCLSLHILGGREFPRWLGLVGVPASVVVMAPTLAVFGADLPIDISIASATMQFWMIAAGVILIMRSRNATQV